MFHGRLRLSQCSISYKWKNAHFPGSVPVASFGTKLVGEFSAAFYWLAAWPRWQARQWSARTLNFFWTRKLVVYFCFNYLYSNESVIGYVDLSVFNETWPKCSSAHQIVWSFYENLNIFPVTTHWATAVRKCSTQPIEISKTPHTLY